MHCKACLLVTCLHRTMSRTLHTVSLSLSPKVSAAACDDSSCRTL